MTEDKGAFSECSPPMQNRGPVPVVVVWFPWVTGVTGRTADNSGVPDPVHCHSLTHTHTHIHC